MTDNAYNAAVGVNASGMNDVSANAAGVNEAGADAGRIRAIAVVGPTASGKTALAVELALRFGGEVISCDSMQLYRGLDIGTAKPTDDEMRGVPHHMIDVADPREDYSAAEYGVAARRCVREIAARGNVPIFCGGTGLYLDAALYDDPDRVDEGAPDAVYRASMLALAEAGYAGFLHDRLRALDPDAAESIDPHNVVRVVRALEIIRSTGMTKTMRDALARSKTPVCDVVTLGLTFSDRSALYERINARVDAMLAAGLADETRALYEAGMLTGGGARAIGYKELLPYVRGENPLDECAEELKKATRRYAKRQLTWFSHHPDVITLDAQSKTLAVDAENILISRGFTPRDQ